MVLGSKAQVSMEFMVAILIIMLFFIYGLVLFNDKTQFNVTSSNTWITQEIAFKISRGINNAYLLDENAFVTENVVWDLNGQTVSFEARSVQVYYKKIFADATIATNNVVVNVTDWNGTIYFRKTNGIVVIGYS